MPIKRRASAILSTFQKAQTELIGKAVVLTDGSAAPTVAQLRDHVAKSLDPTAAPREVHIVATLPRRGIGKVDRRALAQRFGG